MAGVREPIECTENSLRDLNLVLYLYDTHANCQSGTFY